MKSFLRRYFGSTIAAPEPIAVTEAGDRIGLIAGNGSLPLLFAERARRAGFSVYAVGFIGETTEELRTNVRELTLVKVGELGRMIQSLSHAGIRRAAMAGGISRIRLFGGVKLDARGAKLLWKLRSRKDDDIMRGVASEFEQDGIEIIPSTYFLKDCMAQEGVLTSRAPTEDEVEDIRVGRDAIKGLSAQHIGQLVVVREGVVVAVEAVEGSDATIRRGGELGGKGSVVVKCAKPDQDMRFDVPLVGVRTIETMKAAGAMVLSIEAGRTLLLDEAKVISLADRAGISIVVSPPLTTTPLSFFEDER